MGMFQFWKLVAKELRPYNHLIIYLVCVSHAFHFTFGIGVGNNYVKN